MNEIESIRSELRELRHRVDVLEGVQHQPQKATIATPTTAPQHAEPIHHGPTAKYGVLRLILGIVGGTWLLGGLAGLNPGLIIVGLILVALAFVWPWKTTETQTGTSRVSTSTVAPTTPHLTQPRQPSAFEKEFATHWLSWLGMISVVVGVGFLLQYVFRSMGPWGNILTGISIGVILFFLSATAKRTTPAFSFLLQSGGWATVFISTLSLRSVSGGTLLPAQLTTVALLAVVASMITAAMFQHSKTLTAGGFLLGYIGLWAAPLETSTFVMFALLAIGMAFVASVQRWPSLITIGTLVAYIVTVSWMDYTGSDLDAQLGTAMMLIIVQALAFGVAHWTVKAEKKMDEQYTVLGTILNLAGLFLVLNFLFQITHTTSRWEVAGILALICGFLAAMTKVVKSKQSLETPYWIFASAFLAYASFQALHGTNYLLVLILETAVISVGGILGKLRGLRWSGYALSALMFFSILPRMLEGKILTQPYITSVFTISILGVVVFFLIAYLEKHRGGSRYTAIVYADVALGMALLISAMAWPNAWAASVWGILSIIVAVYGFSRKSRNARYVAIIIALMAAFYWLTAVAPYHTLAGSLGITARLLSGVFLVAILGALAMIQKADTARPKDEAQVPVALWWSAIVFLVIVLAVEVTGTWLSVAWGITGIVLLAIGLSGKIRTARRQGLSLVLLTLAKLYVIDISTLSKGARIVSFILLGVLILGISYWYNRLRAPHDHPTTTA